MEPYLDQFTDLFQSHLPRLLLALLVLVAGWVIAKIGAAIARGVLGKTSLDNRVADWAMGGEKQEAVQVEAGAGRIVFWIIMIFALVAFFSILGLSAVTQPLEEFLQEIFTYIPRLFAAGALLLVAWAIASGLRFAVAKGLAATKLDSRLQSEVDDETVAPSQALAESVYWLVFLLFLPAVLGTLGLHGLLAPVNELLNKVMAFLPNLFVALVILGVGWLVARTVQRVVQNLLAAVGLDGIGQRIGTDKVLGEGRLSMLLSYVVYVLVLVPVVIAALDALKLAALTRPASDMLASLLAAIPAIFAAAVVLFVAYLVGRLVSELVSGLLAGVGFDRFLERIGFGRAAAAEGEDGSRTPSQLVGMLVLVAILLFATVEALGLLGFGALAMIVSQFIVFGGNVLLGVVILALGLYFASLAADAIRSSSTQHSNMLANVAQGAVIVLAGAMALRQAGLAEDIINLAFGLILGAVAVAAALAFGLGGRDLAARRLSEWSAKLDGDD